MSVVKNTNKKVKGTIKLNIPASSANPAPPIGPALGSNQINIMDFCNKFNKLTEKIDKKLILSTKITVYQDKTYDINIFGPTVTCLIKNALDIKSGSKNPGKEFLEKKLTRKQIESIVDEKMKYFNCSSREAAFNIVSGSARSMGIICDLD